MATQAETEIAVEECLQKISQEYKIAFKKFETKEYTKGNYSSSTWTYNTIYNRVSLEYWFSSVTSRKEDVTTTFLVDDDKELLDQKLREGLIKLQAFVKKKKGIF